MHTTIERIVFQKQLELVGKISTKHVTLPVLQCVLIEATASEVILKATNLEVGITATSPATTEESGKVAVSAQTLLQTIQYMNQKNITLRVEDEVLLIEGTGFETTIKTIPYEEFPVISELSGTGQILQKTTFALGIKTVAFAASQSSIKPELGSVFISQKKEHSLTFVATDSFRLMEKTIPQKGVILDDSILIPQKNALELARICEAVDGEVELRVNENQCALVFKEGVYVTSRLVAGSFPDYEQIIPKEYVSHTTLLKSDFLHILKKTSIFLNKFSQVTLTVTTDSLTVTANNGDVGTTTESVRATTDGDELTLSFNQRYLTDPMGSITDDSIILHFAGVSRPMVVTGVTDQTLRYLVMPMNK